LDNLLSVLSVLSTDTPLKVAHHNAKHYDTALDEVSLSYTSEFRKTFDVSGERVPS